MQSLTFRKLKRAGHPGPGATTTARISVDFMIDGTSLLALLLKRDDGDGDFMGCFVDGSTQENATKLSRLLNAREPETEEGRFLLYVCPECGDISCGAYAARISIARDTVTWHDFAYENGYEHGRVVPSIGPFVFSLAEYQANLGAASAA